LDDKLEESLVEHGGDEGGQQDEEHLYGDAVVGLGEYQTGQIHTRLESLHEQLLFGGFVEESVKIYAH
jgi:hypothetical protein